MNLARELSSAFGQAFANLAEIAKRMLFRAGGPIEYKALHHQHKIALVAQRLSKRIVAFQPARPIAGPSRIQQRRRIKPIFLAFSPMVANVDVAANVAPYFARTSRDAPRAALQLPW